MGEGRIVGTSIGFFHTVENNRVKAKLHTRREMQLETSDAYADRLHEVTMREMLVTYFITLHIWLPNSQFY